MYINGLIFFSFFGIKVNDIFSQKTIIVSGGIGAFSRKKIVILKRKRDVR
tara:strand:- start:205 stop:354 length:150 start_codon:yes stop_codon:yes gene_type:complete